MIQKSLNRSQVFTLNNLKLFQHQQQVLTETEGQNKVAYYLDMGLGKTFVGAEKMISLGSKLNLVICQKSKVNDWVEHFKRHYNNVSVRNLTNATEMATVPNWNNSACVKIIGVVNYELSWRRPELLQFQHFTLMLDESSLIQNKKAKQTKFILKMKPDNVILLSGTPTSKYENLWTQIHLLGWDISERLYEKQYINTYWMEAGGMKFKQVDKNNPYKNVDRLKSKLRQYGAVFMKTEEVFDLPEQNFIDVKVEASKEYKKFMKNSFIEFDDVELVGDTSLTKLLYARQLCSIYSESKLNAFKDLLNSTHDRLIVFYNFNAELEALKGVCEVSERPYSLVNGSVKDLSAYEEKIDSVTFIQYQAGAMGLNLQKANKIIYYSLPLRSELFEQSKKRIHRIGQNQPCFYYSLICKGTVEEKIQRTLKERKDYSDELFKKEFD